ncbi:MULTISPECIES: hypothetical protein [Nocardia]|uniref:Lipoprotein n=2 Tax=Nocardia TaxID=1817 RepID=A0A846WEE4_9NOCA|nr:MULTISPECIES: hypothetical protein [Nocardia]MCA2210556.1 hypothetical protein [Nocardia rosealba]NKX90957.1 hypothetical protein [Nocardia coubleae]
MSRFRLVASLLALATVSATACAGPDHSRANGVETTTEAPLHSIFAQPGKPAVSPSGRFQAEVNPSEPLSMFVSITDTGTGQIVFRDTDQYSTSRHHRYVVGWISSEPEQLWVYSGDVGTSRFDRQADGNWLKVRSPQHIPAEIDSW